MEKHVTDKGRNLRGLSNARRKGRPAPNARAQIVAAAQAAFDEGLAYKESFNLFEAVILKAALDKADWNYQAAQKLLGITYRDYMKYVLDNRHRYLKPGWKPDTTPAPKPSLLRPSKRRRRQIGNVTYL
jgi:transcriptional regulator with AAA-type ATPase domain